MNKYFKPKSTAWWSGIALIVYGVLTKDWARIPEGLSIIGIRAQL